MMTPDERRQVIAEVTEDFLIQRGVNNPCLACSGVGTQTYASTSTWRGGIGGMAMTVDVCDRCWGSGDQDRPWPSHREFDQLKNTPTLDDYQKLEHTLGMRSGFTGGYRNRFIAGPDDVPSLERLRMAGLVAREKETDDAELTCYRATVAGCLKVGLSLKTAKELTK